MPTPFATCWASRSTPTAMLPPDAQAYGFDTNADALSIEPALLDRYLTAAAKIARLAVGDPTLRPTFERYTAVKGNSNEQTWLWQTDRLGEDFPLGSRGGIAARHYFPLDGEYVFKVRLARTYADVIRGLNVAERDRDSRRRRASRHVHDWRRPELAAADGATARPSGREESAQRRGRGVAGARAAEGRPPPGRRHHRQVRPGQARGAGSGSHSDLEPRIRRAERAAVHLVAADWRPVQRPGAAGFAQPPPHLRLPSRQPRTEETRVRDEDSVDAGATRVSPAGDRRGRADAAGLLQARPRRRRFRCRRPRRARTAARQPRFSVSDRSRSRQGRAAARPIVSPTSSWRRACRSSCGAASRTTNCSTWRFAGKLQRSGSSRAAGAAHARRSARARRAGAATSSASGCRPATSGC